MNFGIILYNETDVKYLSTFLFSGISGLCAIITHPPSPVLSDGEVNDIFEIINGN